MGVALWFILCKHKAFRLITGNVSAIGSILDFYFDGPPEPPSLRRVVLEKKKALRLKKEDPFRRYKKSTLIGEGGMGKVFKVVDKETGEVCAAKTMKVNNVKMVGS